MKKLILSALLLIAPLKATISNFDQIDRRCLKNSKVVLLSLYGLCKQFTSEYKWNRAMSVAHNQEQITAMQKMFGHDWANKINTEEEALPTKEEVKKLFKKTHSEDHISIVRWGIQHEFRIINKIARNVYGLTEDCKEISLDTLPKRDRAKKATSPSKFISRYKKRKPLDPKYSGDGFSQSEEPQAQKEGISNSEKDTSQKTKFEPLQVSDASSTDDESCTSSSKSSESDDESLQLSGSHIDDKLSDSEDELIFDMDDTSI